MNESQPINLEGKAHEIRMAYIQALDDLDKECEKKSKDIEHRLLAQKAELKGQKGLNPGTYLARERTINKMAQGSRSSLEAYKSRRSAEIFSQYAKELRQWGAEEFFEKTRKYIKEPKIKESERED
jgi:hypothetical protein